MFHHHVYDTKKERCECWIVVAENGCFANNVKKTEKTNVFNCGQKTKRFVHVFHKEATNPKLRDFSIVVDAYFPFHRLTSPDDGKYESIYKINNVLV